ncbi:MAG: HAD family hydrolase [Anaerolineaceae bacterium]|nr:HAD family hydrolase [Anaerolineaceae bacterium]
MQNVKAIFFDVDGTLVSYTDHKVHPKDLESFQKLRDKGIRLFIASGRDFEIPAEAAVLDPVRPYMDGFIGVNGQRSMTADGTIISSHELDHDDVCAVRRCCEENGLAMLYYYEDRVYVTAITDLVHKFADYVGLPVPQLRPLAPDEGTPRKVCIYVTEEQEIRLLRPLLKHTLTTNNHDFLSDLIPEGIGKERGIQDICAYYGIDPKETMAFGDGENDMSMLRYAGIGVAMGIAPDVVKESADHVTDTAENAGITKALKFFGII